MCTPLYCTDPLCTPSHSMDPLSLRRPFPLAGRPHSHMALSMLRLRYMAILNWRTSSLQPSEMGTAAHERDTGRIRRDGERGVRSQTSVWCKAACYSHCVLFAFSSCFHCVYNGVAAVLLCCCCTPLVLELHLGCTVARVLLCCCCITAVQLQWVCRSVLCSSVLLH